MPDDIALQRQVRERLNRAGVTNVIGVVAPLFYDGDWSVYLTGDRSAEARAALAALPGVADIREREQAASVINFSLDRTRWSPPAPSPWPPPPSGRWTQQPPTSN